MKKLLPLLLCLLALPAFGYELNGVKLGGKEMDVKKAFPSAHCKALEWKTDAASRRCDDARVSVGGVLTRITVYLKADVIQGYELRFDTKDLERVRAALRAQWGAPLAEATEVISKKDKEDRKVFKMRWEKGADVAVLTAQLEKRRGGVDVSRGNFATEIYRVK
jgi:cation transport regulator ChaB